MGNFQVFGYRKIHCKSPREREELTHTEIERVVNCVKMKAQHTEAGGTHPAELHAPRSALNAYVRREERSPSNRRSFSSAKSGKTSKPNLSKKEKC